MQDVPPTLHGINLDPPAGSLMMIVTPVGGGKSALLLTLLGRIAHGCNQYRITQACRAEIPPTLHGIDLELPAGSLTVVVGAVGSGKSALLLAMLGEMHGSSAAPRVAGSVAYTAQDPWITNATLYFLSSGCQWCWPGF